MSDVNFIHCPSCNWPYLPGEALYCTKCGDKLSRSINPAEEIKRLEKEPKPYEALRFTSGLIVFLGWLVIFFGWIIAFTFGSAIAQIIGKDILVSDASQTVLQNWNALILVLIGSVNTIFGIVMIAMGQVFAVMLDIRNDTHVTMRLVRRFGLLMSEK